MHACNFSHPKLFSLHSSMMFLHLMRQTRVQLWEEKKHLKYDGIFDANVYELASGRKRRYQTKLGLLFCLHYKQKGIVFAIANTIFYAFMNIKKCFRWDEIIHALIGFELKYKLNKIEMILHRKHKLEDIQSRCELLY